MKVDVRNIAEKDVIRVLRILKKYYSPYHSPKKFYKDTKDYGILLPTYNGSCQTRNKSGILIPLKEFLAKYNTPTRVNIKGLLCL